VSVTGAEHWFVAGTGTVTVSAIGTQHQTVAGV